MDIFLKKRIENEKVYKLNFSSFDFECTADTQLESGDFDHCVNLVTAQVFCNSCIKSGRWNKPLEENECDVCGDERFLCWAPFNFTADIKADRIAVCDDPLTAFIHWLLFETSKRYKSLCFAHYGGKICFVVLFQDHIKHVVYFKVATTRN